MPKLVLSPTTAKHLQDYVKLTASGIPTIPQPLLDSLEADAKMSGLPNIGGIIAIFKQFLPILIQDLPSILSLIEAILPIFTGGGTVTPPPPPPPPPATGDPGPPTITQVP